MKFYENTLITKQDLPKSELEKIKDKYSEIINNGYPPEKIVLGADSVIDLENNIVSKPKDRLEAMEILKKLNNNKHYLISSLCISKNGSMIWNHTDKALLTMKNFSDKELSEYLSKITDENLYSYNVYQVEGEGKNLFSNIEGDKDTIMGLPIRELKNYLKNL